MFPGTTYGLSGFLSPQAHVCCTWMLAWVLLTDRATLRSADDPAQLQAPPSATLHACAIDNPVARFCKTKEASLADPVLKSRTYQLGMVKELLVQLAVSCLNASALGAAAARDEELTERMTANDAAKVRAMVRKTVGVDSLRNSY